MNILVVDIGGTHIKFRTQLQAEPVKVKSGSKMTPERMMCEINTKTTGWKYDRVSLGYPGLVIHNVPLTEPQNLGKGWRQFDYKKAFGGKSIRIVNDGAMQALGSYRGRRMLFLGLGTGLGSAMVVDGIVQDIALAHLGWKKGKTYEDVLGKEALTRKGRRDWLKNLEKVIRSLEINLKPDYVTIGGGNAKLVNGLSNNVRIGTNKDAFKGGFLLWGDGSRKVKKVT
jgi:polyphosphate glucokinase